MLHLLQAVIVGAVLFSNIYWEWTPNGYLASLIGIGVAYLVTVALFRFKLWTGRLGSQ